jgi:hypothetical protein
LPKSIEFGDPEDYEWVPGDGSGESEIAGGTADAAGTTRITAGSYLKDGENGVFFPAARARGETDGSYYPWPGPYANYRSGSSQIDGWAYIMNLDENGAIPDTGNSYRWGRSVRCLRQE